MMALILICDRCDAAQADPPPHPATQIVPHDVPQSARERGAAHGWQVRATLMQPDLCPVCVAELTAARWSITEETA